MQTGEMILSKVQASLPTAEKLFEEQVDQSVLDTVTGARITFEDILHALPGVYPTIALGSIERLAKHGKLPGSLADSIIASAGRVPELRRYNDASGFPVPHPLDFEWRFATDAQKLLWENVLELSQDGDTVALLGTPSLFQYASERQGNQRHYVLVDASQPLVDSLSRPAFSGSVNFGSAICCDIPHGRLPTLTAQVVVIDPPWYPAHIRTFLWAASLLCAAGGHVLLSAPPVGTRPGIKEEWAEMLELAEGMSLRLERSQPSALPYVSPPFERNALRAAGISSYPYEWRRGDLMMFRHTGQASHHSLPLPYCSVSSLSPNPEWVEEDVEGVRIRMRQRERPLGDPRLVSIVAGDVLPSVSRRDERRPMAEVWTSGNRIFHCADPAILRQVCRAVVRGETAATYVAGALRRTLTPKQVRLVTDTGEQLRRLIKIERGELDRYGW